MAVEGSLDLFHLPEILQVISQERKTGILTIQGSDDIIAVSFLQGRVVAADALNATTEEGLGAVLVEEGRVPEDVLRRLAARAEAEGVRLGDLLVQEGHLDREGLLEGLRTQTSRLLRSLLEWRRGDFKFYGGDEVSYEEGFRSIGVDELLLSALREGAREERHAVPELDSRLRRLEADRPVRVRPQAGLDGARAGADSDSAVVWITPAEQRVLEAVGSGRTVEEVARQAEVPADRARYVLYRFLREGLVAPAGGRPGAPRPEPAPEAGPAAPRGTPGREEAAPAAEAPPARAPARPLVQRESVERPRLLPGGLALVAALLALASVALASVAFLFPFPWMEAERAALHDERDSVRLLEIDQAAKVFFLLEGRFPDDLEELVAVGLLEPGDLTDSRGRRLSYESRERRYAVRPIVTGASPEAIEAFQEGIAGNFLLDPDFLDRARRPSGAQPPLVLLD